jgi:hypothetical protein
MSLTALSDSLHKFVMIERGCFGDALLHVAAYPDIPVQHPSTGTEDDDDEPEDEHDGENEANQHEKRDNMEFPEEMQRDDEDRRETDG